MFKTTSRRQFLISSAAAGAVAASPFRKAFARDAADQVNVGIIGLGGRGSGMCEVFAKLPGVRVAALCDADRARVDKAATKTPADLKCTDMRRVFDAPDIDAVYIATCNHWHCLAAIWAMQAGKHVLVEKPLGNTIWESRQVVNAAQAHQRICQLGTQQRSDRMQDEIRHFLHEAKPLGEIESVRVNRFGVRKSIGKRSEPLTPPATVDYNLWLGPAQELPLYRGNFHYDWHWVWNTGSGEMGNWGVHIIDDVRGNVFLDKVAAPKSITAAGARLLWGDAGETPNVHLASLDTGGVPVVVALSNLSLDEEGIKIPGPPSGYIAQCEGGQFHGERGKAVAIDADGKPIKQFKGDPSNTVHAQSFVDAIRNDDPSRLTAPIEVGHDSTTWCNLINIASRLPVAEGGLSMQGLQETLGDDFLASAVDQVEQVARGAGGDASRLRLGPTVQYDADRERFVGDLADAANQLLHREDRAGFEVPEIQAPSTQTARAS